MEAHKTPTLTKPLSHGFVSVGWENAARQGEPFEECIVSHNMLPNVVTRFCTQELKIRPMRKFVRETTGWDHWNVAIGIRADEPRRLSRGKGNKTKERYEVCHPLGDAGVTLKDVTRFWKEHPFDLGIESESGNCDLCHLKRTATRVRLIRERPDDAKWWIRMEAAAVRRGLARNPRISLFRKDTPRYSALLEMSQQPSLWDDLDEPDDLSGNCHCTD